jgi:hypothetical protein
MDITAQKAAYHQTVEGKSGAPAEAWENNRYQVLVRRNTSDRKGMPDIIHLSIRSLDRSADHDWRHLQRIKNEILGPEMEAVELYPAESRLVDTSNQYHLWAFDVSAGTTCFPFGYVERLVTEGNKGVTKQRPFEDGFRPDDCQKLEDLKI